MGHHYSRRRFNVAGNGHLVSLETQFSTGWTKCPPYSLMLSADRQTGEATIKLAVNADTPDYRNLLSNAKQETIKSTGMTLSKLWSAQKEQGAGLEEPLSDHTERHMARLAMAHIIQQRGFSLADLSIVGLFVNVAASHSPSAEVLKHPAFASRVFDSQPL